MSEHRAKRSPWHPPEPIGRSAEPSVKRWSQLEQAAKADDLRLFRTPGCVTVEDLAHRPQVTITTDQIDSDEEADKLCRAALAAALDALRSMRQ